MLDLDRLRRHPFLAAVEWHDTLGSTNDRAGELAARGDVALPLLVLAGRQTSGRGRGDHRWWSGPGAATCSLLIDPAVLPRAAERPTEWLPTDALPPGLRPEHWPRVALVAGAALCEALESLAPHLGFGLKWPNDVLLEGRKLAGILTEVPPAAPGVARRLILGMGVNVNNSLSALPEDVRGTAASLTDETGLEFDITGLLWAWLDRFALGLAALAADDPRLPRRWQSRCVLTGRAVELQVGDRMRQGRCLGIADDGSLLLETAHGPENVYAGALVRICD